MIKLFPADEMGVAYFKSLQGPYNSTAFLAVGGIHIDNVEQWFMAGAAEVGVGNPHQSSAFIIVRPP